MSLPEVVSIIHLLQDIADVRLKIAWLAWGSDWLPGTMIEQCLFQLPVATASDPAPPPPHTQTTLPRAMAVRAAAPSPVPIATLNLEPAKESDESPTSGTAVKTVAPAAAFVAAPDHGPEKESDATYTAKRTAPNKVISHSSCGLPFTDLHTRLFPLVALSALINELVSSPLSWSSQSRIGRW